VQTHIEQGVMRVTHAVADTSDSTLRVGGQVDLGEETLALRTVAKPKDFSPFSLRTPVLVGGTLKSPVLGIEGSRLAPRLAAAAALALVAGPAGLLPFLEFGSEAPPGPDPCQPVR
jgi:AsmA protein